MDIRNETFNAVSYGNAANLLEACKVACTGRTSNKAGSVAIATQNQVLHLQVKIPGNY